LHRLHHKLVAADQGAEPFSLPFLMPDYAAIDALTQGEVGRDMFRILEKNGVVPLAWGENGYREVTNSKRPVHKPEDMKGLKFRVVGSPIFNDTFTALGANPTQMSWRTRSRRSRQVPWTDRRILLASSRRPNCTPWDRKT